MGAKQPVEPVTKTGMFIRKNGEVNFGMQLPGDIPAIVIAQDAYNALCERAAKLEAAEGAIKTLDGQILDLKAKIKELEKPVPDETPRDPSNGQDSPGQPGTPGPVGQSVEPAVESVVQD